MDTLGARFIDTKHPHSAPSEAGTPFFAQICSRAMDISGQKKFSASPLINFSILGPIVIKKIASDLSLDELNK